MPLVPAAPAAGADSGARQLELLERAVSVALSPLDFDDAVSWGDALTAALCALTNARAGVFLIPELGAGWRAVACGPGTADVVACWGLHGEATERLQDQTSGDLVIWARDDLQDDPGSATTASPPSGTIGIRVRTPQGSVAAVCVHRDPSRGVPQSVVAVLRTVAPAFRTGVTALVGSNRVRSDLVRMLDSLAEPALLFDLSGVVTHASSAMQRVGSAADAARLQSEAQRLAWSIGAVARRRSLGGQVCGNADAIESGERTVRLGTTIYRLRGALVGGQLLGASPAILVTMTAAAAEPLSDDALHTMFGLTAREIQVARLVAEGLSNNEIAERLGVKFFTARNHVERTLAKLRVPTRHRVGPLLRNETSSDLTPGRSAA